MNENSRNSGKLMIICFFVLFCGTAFGMGWSVIEAAISFSPYGPPIFMALVPIGMGIFGIVFCLTVLKQSNKQTSRFSRYRATETVYTGDYTIRSDTSSKQKSIYRVPPICPSCGADINTETVDWVGPLQAKCPYCGATVEAQERVL